MKLADRASSIAVQPAPEAAVRYLVSLAIGGALVLCAYACLLVLLDRTGHLPPPPIANNICIDEKLAFLRQNPPEAPNLLIVGSSVAWRHFDSGFVAGLVSGARPLNGAFCALRLNQSVFVADWLLERLPSIRQVVMIASPHDFENCATQPAAVFNRQAADSFVFANGWRWGFYFRFFDPMSLARNTLRVAAMRSNARGLAPLVFTRFGDGPLDGDARELLYGGIRRFDPTCFAALRTMAARLSMDGREFLVVGTPLHPEWKRQFDPDGTTRVELERRSRAALGGTAGQYWNGDAAMSMEPHAFIDAVHIRWSAVRGFSEAVVQQLRSPHARSGTHPQ